jgi:hypothetical protein
MITQVVIINGMVANLVNNPKIKKREQKNSANTTKAKLMVLPIPKKFIKIFCLVEKWINLSYPCSSIKIPTDNLNNNIAVLTAAAEYFVESNFFIFFWIKGYWFILFSILQNP